MPKNEKEGATKDDASKLSGEKEVIIRRRVLEVKNGVLMHAHHIAEKPGDKAYYYHVKDISIGPKNARRDIRVHFESLEAEENEELLHLLDENIRA